MGISLLSLSTFIALEILHNIAYTAYTTIFSETGKFVIGQMRPSSMKGDNDRFVSKEPIR